MSIKIVNPSPMELKEKTQKSELMLRQAKDQEVIEAAERHQVSGYTDGRDLVNQLLGQAQAFSAASELLRTFGIQKLAYVKENKLYRGLSGKKSPDGTESNGTWAGFCALLGISVDKADEDITNLRTFGEQALENMSRMGIGYRELRQYRRLPEDERAALIAVAKDGDKDSLLDIAESLIAKHAKEKEALVKRIDDLSADNDAKNKIIEKKNTALTSLEVQLNKVANLKPDERAASLSDRLNKALLGVAGELLIPQGVIKEILEWEDAPRDLRHACAQAIARIKIRIDAIQKDFMLPIVDVDFDDSWMLEKSE